VRTTSESAEVLRVPELERVPLLMFPARLNVRGPHHSIHAAASYSLELGGKRCRQQSRWRV